jgi:hypothetical protein
MKNGYRAIALLALVATVGCGGSSSGDGGGSAGSTLGTAGAGGAAAGSAGASSVGGSGGTATAGMGGVGGGKAGTGGVGGTGGSGGVAGNAGVGGASAGAGGGGGGGGSGGSGMVDCNVAASAPMIVNLPKASVTKPSLRGLGIVPTSTGFVIGFHEGSTDGTADALTLVTLGTDGTLGTPQHAPLSACAGSGPGNGLGFALRGNAGLAAIPKAPCGMDGAGLSLVQFSAGALPQDTYFLQGPAGFPEISIPSHRALSPVPGSVNVRVSYVQSGTASSFDASGVMPSSGFTPFAGGSGDTVTGVASTSSNKAIVQAAAGSKQVTITANGPGFAKPTSLAGSAAPFVSATAMTGGSFAVVSLDTDGTTLRAYAIGDDGSASAQTSATIAASTAFDVAPTTAGFILATRTSSQISVRAATLGGGALFPDPAETKVPLTAGEAGKSIAAAISGNVIAVVWLAADGPASATDPVGRVMLLSCP